MRKLSALLLFLFVIAVQDLKAADYKAGDITYTWVSDSTYQFTVRLYSSCTGAIIPLSTLTLCYYNDCNAQNGSIILPQVGATQPAPPAYREYKYQGNITLMSRCVNWVFYTVPGPRDSTNNLVMDPGNNIYLEARLNNRDGQGNSAATFNAPPITNVAYHIPGGINPGAVDPNNDSLVFTMVRPLTAGTTCMSSYTATIISFSSTVIYNLTTNPFGTGNTFMINPITGIMTFVPVDSGSSTYALRVDDYRNGIKMGSVTRDAQLNVKTTLVHGAIQSSITNLQNCSQSSGSITAAPGAQIGFCVNIWIAGHSTSNVLRALSNHAVVMPGSSQQINGQHTDSLTACLSWATTMADTGLHILSFSVRDSSLLPPCEAGYGAPVDGLFSIPISIRVPNAVGSVPMPDKIRIYPNPANNVVHIDADIPVKIVLLNPEGRIVAASREKTMDIHSLAAGLYFIQIYNGKGRLIRTEKLIKLQE